MFELVKTTLAETGRLPFRIVPECLPAAATSTTEMRGGVEVTIDPCNPDHLVEMGFNIINALIAIGFLVTVLFIIIGGFRMVISAGSPERIQQARANITSAVTGLVITLIAWVAINTFITLFTSCEGAWYAFSSLTCGG